MIRNKETMIFSNDTLRTMISEKNLKVTPQRIAVLKAILELGNHPTAEQVLVELDRSFLGMSKGTLYKVLETLVDKELIKRVKTDRDILRYDGNLGVHHHLYCSECDMIEDYEDKELDAILKAYFKNKKLKEGFEIEDVVLQIRGTFTECQV